MATTDPIPFPITTEILSRLPLKTLVRFRLACKLWESTICDQKFRYSSVYRCVFTVCNRASQSLSFLTSPPATEVVEASFPLEAQGRLTLPDDFCFTRFQDLGTRLGDGVDPASRPIQFPLVESVHGLIIVENKHSVVIYNPSTRGSKQLPDADPPLVEKGGLWDNRRAYGKTVLHYDPFSDKYICLRFQRHPDRNFDGRIIGLQDSEWSKLPRPPKHKGVPWFGFDPSSAYLGGALYLASADGQLVRFHPSSGTFEKVIPPSGLDSRVLMRVLFVYQGKLAMTSRLMKNAYDRCLFTLEDKLGKVWTRIDFVADTETRRRVKECEKRTITDGGEIVLGNRDLRMRNDIYYYNPSNGTLRVLVAEVTSLAQDDFMTQFGDGHPRALLHIDHVEHLMFLK